LTLKFTFKGLGRRTAQNPAIMRGTCIRLAVFISGAVFVAGMALLANTPAKAKESAQSSAPRVVLIEDQAHAAFRFMIDGHEVARLDSEGLHVRHSIDYGDTLTDTGTAYYDSHAMVQGLTP
jgi:hypothetical protein